MKPAVFFDRDGTLIEDVHYLSDPTKVRLLPGAAQAVRALADRGFRCVVVTNQSAVGRGLMTLDQMHAVNAEVQRQFVESAGIRFDGFFYCTSVPRTADRVTVDHPDRKPGPGMLLRAARELALELRASWMVGDMMSDILAGKNAGCIGAILISTGKASTGQSDDPAITYVAESMGAAAQFILGHAGLPVPRPINHDSTTS